MVLRPGPSLALQVFILWIGPISASIQDQYCENLSPISNTTGLQCNASIDLIGTCWPRSAAGQLVARPCPEYFYGVRYNTTSKARGSDGARGGGTGRE
uniref:G-protein coupled receptors family 2 profile 1 domain-containing protein n=1 Tax=Pelodiscus sinensis TaxID=13735 RepID=K7FS13_PELSI